MLSKLLVTSNVMDDSTAGSSFFSTGSSLEDVLATEHFFTEGENLTLSLRQAGAVSKKIDCFFLVYWVHLNDIYIKYWVVGSPVAWKQACIIYDTTVLKGYKNRMYRFSTDYNQIRNAS